MEGSFRFINRVWRIIWHYRESVALGQYYKGKNGTHYEEALLTEPDKELRRALNATIKKVTEDIEQRFNFNTAISSLMELVNAMYAYKDAGVYTCGLVHETVKDLLLLLAPFVPHVAEELWHSVIDENSSVHDQSWPEYDEAALKVDNVEIVLQINGKVRGRLVVPSEASKEELEKVALADERIKSLIGDGTVRKVIAVPGRLVNIVVK